MAPNGPYTSDDDPLEMPRVGNHTIVGGHGCGASRCKQKSDPVANRVPSAMGEGNQQTHRFLIHLHPVARARAVAATHSYPTHALPHCFNRD